LAHELRQLSRGQKITDAGEIPDGCDDYRDQFTDGGDFIGWRADFSSRQKNPGGSSSSSNNDFTSRPTAGDN